MKLCIISLIISTLKCMHNHGVSGFWFQYKPLDQVVYSAPSALGMHGQSLEIGNMSTRMIFKAPGVKAVRVPKGSLLDAVPTFTHLMGMQKPADCVGKVALPGFND